GAAIKPDLFAIALTVGGVAVLDRRRGARAAFVAGALLELALWSKPTAALPAVAVLAWALLRERERVVPLLGGLIAAAGVMLAYAVALGPLDVWRHVVSWNVLPWSAEQTVLVVVLGVATLGVVLA